MSSNRVVVLGASGFIGSHVVFKPKLGPLLGWRPATLISRSGVRRDSGIRPEIG